MKIRNYICTYADKMNGSPDTRHTMPDAHLVFSDTAAYRQAVECLSCGSAFLFFPVTNTLEAELQGAIINEDSFIRVKHPLVTAVDDLFALKEFNFTIPHYIRMQESFSLHSDKPLAFEMTGLYTFLSFIISIEKILRAFRKSPETEAKLCSLFLERYFSLIRRLTSADIKLIALADPAASVDIIGPVSMERIINNFYIALLSYILNNTNCAIYLCPKLCYALEDFGFLQSEIIEIEKMKTQDAIKKLMEPKRIFGSLCINTNAEISRVKIFHLTEKKAHYE